MAATFGTATTWTLFLKILLFKAVSSVVTFHLKLLIVPNECWFICCSKLTSYFFFCIRHCENNTRQQIPFSITGSKQLQPLYSKSMELDKKTTQGTSTLMSFLTFCGLLLHWGYFQCIPFLFSLLSVGEFFCDFSDLAYLTGRVLSDAHFLANRWRQMSTLIVQRLWLAGWMSEQSQSLSGRTCA